MKRAISRLPPGRENARTYVIFGVRFTLVSRQADLLEKIEQSLKAFFPMPLRTVKGGVRSEVVFRFNLTDDGYSIVSPFGDGTSEGDEASFLKLVRALVRVHVAANARGHLFIHSGVVEVSGKALLLPGDSYSGKSTLVRSLVEAGATYYSDEYAVIDRNGLVLPFPKALSIRGIEGPHIQTEISAERLGARVGTKRVPIGWVVFTTFRERARWIPKDMSPGNGRLMLVPHLIGIAKRPKFALNTLEKAVSNSRFLATDRGEAAAAARKLLQTLEK